MSGGGQSSGGGGTTNSTVTQNSQPWGAQQDYLTKGFQYALNNVLNRPTSPFPQNSTVPFSPETEASLQGTTNRALMGSPVTANANMQAANILGGGYMDASKNPYLQGAIGAATQPMIDAYTQSVRPSMERTFAMAGRGGQGQGPNGALMGVLNRSDTNFMNSLGGVGMNMANTNYQNAQDMMSRALALSPSLAQADYYDPGMLSQVGAARQGQAQANLNQQVGNWNYAQQEPTMRAQQYMPLVQGNYGGSSTGTTVGQTQQQNPAINPWLTGGGALLGLAPFVGSWF